MPIIYLPVELIRAVRKLVLTVIDTDRRFHQVVA